MEVTTGWAVAMARVSRLKLNDTVSDGFYPCVPATDEGIARVYGALDLVILSIFGRLLEFGMSARVAGTLACEAKVALDADPNAESVYVFTTNIHTRRVMTRRLQSEKYLAAIEFNITAITRALNEAYLKLLKAERG